MQLTTAVPADVGAILELLNAAYRGADQRLGWTNETELIAGPRARPQDLAAMIREGSVTLLLRREANGAAVAGCVGVEMSGPATCTISMLAVAPEAQTSGLGRALMKEAEELGAARGATIAKITVVEQRAALIAWYERRGYHRTGAYEAFPYGDERVGTPLRDDLRFAVLEKQLS